MKLKNKNSIKPVAAHTPHLDALILRLPTGMVADAELDLKQLKDSHAALVEALEAIQHNAEVMNRAEPHAVFSAIADQARAALAAAK